MAKNTIKILALSCSPSKKRNSDSMLDYFLEGIKEFDKENFEIEKVYLNDIKMNYYSYENSKGPMEHEEEFGKLADKIKKSSGLVIATPTYNFSVPSNLKNFIDRIRFFSLDFEKKTRFNQPTGKLGYLHTYFLVSGGTPSWAQKILFFAFPPFWLRGVFLYYGAHYIGASYSGDTNTFQEIKKLEKCKNLGKKYAKKIKKSHIKKMAERFFWRPPSSE